jgi:DTW domain-containing protein YfiP
MSERGTRKTKVPCAGCGLGIERCLCAEIPRLSVRTRLSLVVHHRELKRTSNTGRLAVRALTQSQLCVRGRPGEALDLSGLLDSAYHTVLLYPCEEATTLQAQIDVADGKPLHLIVPDGNWRQASKVHYRHAELKHLPRVLVPAPKQTPVGYLRRETKAEGMATLQAIAEAFAVLEGEEVGRALRDLYQLKLTRTLAARGLLKQSAAED